MTLSSHRKHRIYIAAIIGYCLGSDDPEELSFYNNIRIEIENDRENGNKGISRND